MMKNNANMQKMLDYLERTPIVESACLKLGIARSTFYRWLEDAEFKKKVDQSLERGRSVVDDVAESHLVSNVKDGNIGAVKFWLTNNNPRYKKKMQIIKQQMTPVSEEIIEHYLWLAHQKQYGEKEPPTN